MRSYILIMRSFDLDSLEIFCAVVREGGVLRAAERLNRVQSNVTTRVKNMEQRLGVALFHRRGRRLVLTEAGGIFLQQAEQLLRLAQQTEIMMRTSWVHGPVRLGAMESTVASRLPAILSRFHADHPTIQLGVQTGTTDALLHQLRGHHLDAVMVGEPGDLEGLQTRAVFCEDLVLITAKIHPSVCTPQDLKQVTLLVFAAGCAYRRVLEGWFSDHNRRADQVMELASYQAIIACAAAGAGCGIVPASVLATTQAASEVAQHRLPKEIACNTTHLAWLAENTVKLHPLFEQLKPFEASDDRRV